MSNLSKAVEIYLYLIKHPETEELDGENFAESCFITGSWGYTWRKWIFSFTGEDVQYEVRFLYNFLTLPGYCVQKDFSISYYDEREGSWRWLVLPLSSELEREITESNYK